MRPSTFVVMRAAVFGVALTLAGAGLCADGPATAKLTSTTINAAGQPIVLPQGPVEVTASRVEIPVGGKLPVHKHPWPRYAYVLSGRVRVVYPESGKTVEFGAGDFFAEGVDVWHFGEAVGSEPVRLLVVDQRPPGKANTVLKP